MIYTVVNIPFNDICFKKYFKPKYSQDFKAQNYQKSYKFAYEVLWIPTLIFLQPCVLKLEVSTSVSEIETKH